MSIFIVQDIDTVLFNFLPLPNLLTMKQVNKYYSKINNKLIDEYNIVKHKENKLQYAIENKFNIIANYLYQTIIYINSEYYLTSYYAIGVGNIELAKQHCDDINESLFMILSFNHEIVKPNVIKYLCSQMSTQALKSTIFMRTTTNEIEECLLCELNERTNKIYTYIDIYNEYTKIENTNI